MKSTRPRPPKHLSREARAVWERIRAEADVDDAPAALLLNTLTEAFDRMRQAQALVKKEGLVLEEKTDAGTVKHRAHPALAIERDARAALMRAWRLLGFDQEPGV